ncbi:hypothetical protein EIN_016230 [Entamoeba invadens IP1]|uniref:hypothetical protein n=1 Tax=Entamoeba invadens IP1 TaxID=370355 RepID=UPI0002C3EA86|nr:hypothetical protein EIN_016230 [Entamoeba invadens IP1]ELP90404.1 hypothetical protein EIN_016230 [Entamoeba invadens IP1]|eukprot:XP_004257175.1 hypothetical protein EIN_016230 [Entamoeba invadens IP1]
MSMPDSIRFVIISDTHRKHSFLSLPRGDFLIHCGDFSNSKEYSIRKFAKWLHSQHFLHKLIVLGNNELKITKSTEQISKWISEECSEAVLLINQSVTIDDFVFYGANWGFNGEESFQPDPTKTFVFLSHQPPYNILDMMAVSSLSSPSFHGGSHPILDFISKNKPKLVCFGHSHNCFGVMKDETTTYVNATFVNNLSIPVKGAVILKYIDGEFVRKGYNFFKTI